MNKRNKKKINKFKYIIFLIFIVFIDYINDFKFLNTIVNQFESFYNMIRINQKPIIKNKSCLLLNSNINQIINTEYDKWSISYIDENGNKFISINENQPRIPASNQKLITTAYAIDYFGPNERLKTILKRDITGNYHLVGNGDPDFGIYYINKIIDKIKNENIYRSIFNINKKNKLYMYDIPRTSWWPKGWNNFDKYETYGAPITKLAIEANSSYQSINNPINSTKMAIQKQLLLKNINLEVIPITTQEIRYNIFSKNILTLYSQPIISLLSLINSESHNFTAEIILRNSLNDWSANSSKKDIYNWLSTKNISTKNIKLVDGSGLSRDNKLTSKTISSLLYEMRFNKYWKNFVSSMSIIGVRGTLTNFPVDPSVIGEFYGKSGTLSGIRSLSGYLEPNNNVRIISILTENVTDPDSKISLILSMINNDKSCK